MPEQYSLFGKTVLIVDGPGPAPVRFGPPLIWDRDEELVAFAMAAYVQAKADGRFEALELQEEYGAWRRARGLDPTLAQAIMFVAWQIMLDSREDVPAKGICEGIL